MIVALLPANGSFAIPASGSLNVMLIMQSGTSNLRADDLQDGCRRRYLPPLPGCNGFTYSRAVESSPELDCGKRSRCSNVGWYETERRRSLVLRGKRCLIDTLLPTASKAYLHVGNESVGTGPRLSGRRIRWLVKELHSGERGSWRGRV